MCPFRARNACRVRVRENITCGHDFVPPVGLRFENVGQARAQEASVHAVVRCSALQVQREREHPGAARESYG